MKKVIRKKGGEGKKKIRKKYHPKDYILKKSPHIGG
jgi:hypothetical protein